MSFAAIYRRYHQDLYRYCLAIVGNPEDAQDALQNTMVKAMRALQGEKRQIKLKPWLYRIAHNESVDLLRRRRPTDEIDAELVAAGPDTAETAEVRERLRRLIADLEELPDRQRGALVMRELAGLGFEQIGAAFDTSPAVARQTVYEARIGLQQMNEGREMLCEDVCRTLSDGDGRTIRRRDIRAHLRACPSCRSFRDGVAERRRDLAALAPLPAVASVGLLHGILGGSQGSSGAGLAGAAGGAGKAVATSAIVKTAATVAVVAAVGVSAADRGGLIHVGLPGSGGGKTAHSSGAAGAAGAAGPGAEPTAQPVQEATNPARAQASAKTHRSASHGAGAASGGGAQHSHGASAATAPAPQASSGTQHGKGHGSGPQGTPGNGTQTAAAHGGHAQSSPHAHSHPASASHPNSPSGPHPSSSAPHPGSTGTGPPPHASPPATPGPPSGIGTDNSPGAPFQPTDRSPNQGASGNADAPLKEPKK